MKKYVKDAVKELKESDKLKIEVNLKDKDDYKRNLLRILYNKFVLTIQKKIVPAKLKNLLLRTTGMHIGKDACIPHDIHFDAYFSDLIYLEKGCTVGGLSSLYTHEIKARKLTVGKCILKERVLIGGSSVLKPGSVVSKNSMLMFFSELDKEMPEGELWGGKPAKAIMQFSKEDIEKYFKPSKRLKTYYKTFKKKLNEFQENPEQTYFKIHYDGNRLNAGDDWWRGRNLLRIFYNGIIVETARLLPHSFFKTLLLKMAGVKIGKNCKIGKGVTFDHFYCDFITLEDNVILEDYVYMDGHEYTTTQTVFGRSLFKKGCRVKHHALVRCGTTVGEKAIIEPYSVIQKYIPDKEVWGGIPARKKR